MYYSDDPVRDYDRYMEDNEKEWERRKKEEYKWIEADIQYEEQKINEEDE